MTTRSSAAAQTIRSGIDPCNDAIPTLQLSATSTLDSCVAPKKSSVTTDPLRYRIGVVDVALSSKHRRVRREFDELYFRNRVPWEGEAAVHVEVQRTPFSFRSRRRFEIRVNGVLQFLPADPAAVAPHIEWGVGLELPRALPHCLQLHSAAVELGGRVVLFPGQAGSGKSTLTLGMISRGWSYLSDEFALIDVASNTTLPYPRAICLKEPSFAVAHSIGLQAPRRPAYSKGHKGMVGLISPDEVRDGCCSLGGRVSHVLFPTYIAGAKPIVASMSRADAAMALHSVCFNLWEQRADGVAAIANLVREAQCARLICGDLRATCDLVEKTIRESTP